LSQQLQITYYYHSGFSVKWEDVLLIFDYWLGEKEELPEDKRITRETLNHFSKVYVFVSHEHPDHLDPVIFTWQDHPGIRYIYAADLPTDPDRPEGVILAPGDKADLSDGLTVTAFDSTDLGVSFLVDVAGTNVFHAGDLNFWHWREESTAAEIELADRDFRNAVEPISHENVDVAFCPTDPRQGMLFDAGANYFMLAVKPKLMIPMHFWMREDIVREYARANRCRQTEILPMTAPGENILVEMDDEGFMTVHLAAEMDLAAPEQDERIDLGGYEGHDPFIETDMPVDMGE